MHSRERFLPLYDKALDVEVKRRLAVLGVDVILGERVTLPSAAALARQEQSSEMHQIVTSTGQVVEFDLLVRRFSFLLCCWFSPSWLLIRTVSDTPSFGVRVSYRIQSCWGTSSPTRSTRTDL